MATGYCDSRTRAISNGMDDTDALSLQQALAAIDDWEIDALSLLEDDHVVTPDGSPTRHGPKLTTRIQPYSKPRYDTKRKRELQELRAQVESLQQILLHEQSKPRVGETGDSETAALEREWQAIGARQYRARFVAQMRNKELRKLAEEMQRDAHKISRLGRRILSLEKSLPRSVTLSMTHRFPGPREDPQIQLLRLPGLRQEARTIFTSGAFADHGSERMKVFREVALRDPRSSVAVVEVVFETAWVLPFSAKAVADALWLQTTRVATGTNQIEWNDIHADTSAMVSQFVSVPTNDTAQSIKCGQIATHRGEPESDGSSLIVSNVQVTALHASTALGLYSSDVWARVEPISQLADGPLSQVLWCRRVRVRQPSKASQNPGERAQWMSSILSGYSGSLRAREEQMLTCNMQAVENLLLSSERSRRGSKLE